jgi:uncharacterized protein YbbC (DUF1343 family)
MYKKYPDQGHFFSNPAFFDKLAGTKALRESIQAGKSEAEIRKQWESGLSAYREIRKKYLLYPD